MYPQSMFRAKISKYQNFSAENFQFLNLKKSLFIAIIGHVLVMKDTKAIKYLKYNVPSHEKNINLLKGNQRRRSALQKTFFWPYKDSTLPLLLKSEISSFNFFSVTVQVGLCRTCSKTTLLVFPRVKRRFIFYIILTFLLFFFVSDQNEKFLEDFEQRQVGMRI